MRRLLRTLATAALLVPAACSTTGAGSTSGATAGRSTATAAATAQPTRVLDVAALEAGFPPGTEDARVRTRTHPGGPGVFQPCADARGGVPVTTAGMTGFASARRDGDLDIGVHELAVYADSTAAAAAMRLLRAADRRCTSPDRLRLPGRDVPGDEVLVRVERVRSAGELMPAASHYLVARVGNAVLTVVHHGVFGADPALQRAADQRQRRVAARLLAGLCAYADRTSRIACTPAPLAPGPRAQRPGDGGLDVLAVREETGLGGWRERGDGSGGVLGCGPDRVEELGARRVVHHDYVLDSGAAASPEVATALLVFGDARAAGAAYDTVAAGGLATCSDRIALRRLVVARSDPQRLRLGGAEARWAAVLTTAPDRCTECDAGWYVVTGQALAGRRLVLVEVTTGGDLQTAAHGSVALPGGGPGARVPGLLRRAVAAAGR